MKQQLRYAVCFAWKSSREPDKGGTYMNRKKWIILCIVVVVPALLVATVLAGPLVSPDARVYNVPLVDQGSGFTYQGQLNDGSGPVTGDCDMAFRLFDDGSIGSQVGNAITTTVTINKGLFTVVLNNGGEFGNTAFAGEARWLGIKVKCPSDLSYSEMGRQELTATPYALYALNAPWSGLLEVPDDFADGIDGVGYQNVVVVAKSGGDFTSIQAALDSITDTTPTAPYLVWVAPGTYSETVMMKTNVDIEGAGELVTKITSVSTGSSYTGTVGGADYAELRFLTVENTGGMGGPAIGVYNDGTSPRLTHVTISASYGSGNNYGMLNKNYARPKMTNVTVEATANGSWGAISYGVLNNNSSPEMTDVTISVSDSNGDYGVVNSNNASPRMTNVIINVAGNADAYAVYNDSSSPEMTEVTAKAVGPGDIYGVYNRDASAPIMRNVTTSASEGENNYGVYNFNSSPVMLDVFASASGDQYNYGVYNDSSSVMIEGSTLSASGGTNNYGIGNIGTSGTYTVTVSNCQIVGSTSTISNDSEFTTLVGASLLDGAVTSGAGIITCAGVYDEDYIFNASTCP
jgi:hypothetical protein